MNEMQSSREVILPKMSFGLGATAGMKRNAFIWAWLGQVGGERLQI